MVLASVSGGAWMSLPSAEEAEVVSSTMRVSAKAYRVKVVKVVKVVAKPSKAELTKTDIMK